MCRGNADFFSVALSISERKPGAACAGSSAPDANGYAARSEKGWRTDRL
jgi:hypothetical protein